MAQTQEMALINVKSHDFLKQLVESLAQNISEVKIGKLQKKKNQKQHTLFLMYHI